MKQKYASNNLYRLLILLFFAFIPFISIFSQVKRFKIHEEYIKKYKDIAISNMKKHKIPASITLAQGLAESGAGKSELTLKSNNHFGIKCHKDWTGGKAYHNDDEKNECFRKYRRAEDSFEDHSKFLTGRDRYSSLFSLKTTDYKGWARGLQKAGYATDKAYATKLIKMIEDYELHQYDKPTTNKKEKEKVKEKVKEKEKENNKTVVSTGNNSNGWSIPTNPTITTTENNSILFRHTPYRTYNLVYVIAFNGDTYGKIAAEFNFNVSDLYKYNEVPAGSTLRKGDLVYFEQKKTRADKPNFEHVVRAGESMHIIAQRYGIKVKNLYRMNKRDIQYVPMQGDVLKLR